MQVQPQVGEDSQDQIYWRMCGEQNYHEVHWIPYDSVTNRVLFMNSVMGWGIGNLE